jgi:hypothetical protein
MTPRPYLSLSQIVTFEKSPTAYVNQYVYGKKRGTNRGMAFGKAMATSLEEDEATGDPVLDLMISRIPKFEVMDKIVQDPKNGVPVEYSNPDTGRKETLMLPAIRIKGEAIPILVKPDSARPDLSGFKEYKSGQEAWTKKEVDENDQLDFYSMGMYLVTRVVPADIELVHVETRAEEGTGRIYATGEIYRHPTTRDVAAVLKMMARAGKAWAGINALMESELL